MQLEMVEKSEITLDELLEKAQKLAIHEVIAERIEQKPLYISSFRNPIAVIKIIQNAGHFHPLVQPKVFLKNLREFLHN